MSKSATIPRIGIFTYHFSDNFGALMQAYGLRKWLMDQGCEVEFVNYHPEHVEAGGSIADLLKSGSLKSKAKIVYLKLSAVQRKLFGNRDQIEMFHRFQSGALGVSGPVLRTAEEVDAFLASPAGRFDMLICGSDQIWAPSQQYGIDPVYYLDFPGGAQGARRISYAPSFGRATLDPAYETEVAGYLAGFDGLSAREKSGVEVVEALAQRPTAWVPDPTILLGDYSGLAAGAADVGEGHVFCYALRTGQGIREVAAMAGEPSGPAEGLRFGRRRTGEWRENARPTGSAGSPRSRNACCRGRQGAGLPFFRRQRRTVFRISRSRLSAAAPAIVAASK
ncbi:polysaccharide pyruvyl transferase family protein [Mangrovicoccus ximenensis]|uniref:polysaccharide pyruvyl transferase family protein n=1 Tax=Mangrovicoccus ximenensis TaxID=1911570 RepID=UPI001374FB49|nr:polysaccharide pyruvyl transferase family protein [Mangrovicoccus ximenensis]